MGELFGVRYCYQSVFASYVVLHFPISPYLNNPYLMYQNYGPPRSSHCVRD